MLVITQPVDHQDVARAKQAQHVMQQGGILPGQRERDRGACHPTTGQNGLDASIGEAQLAQMANGGRLGAAELGDQLRVDLDGQVANDEGHDGNSCGKRCASCDAQ